MVVHFRKLLTGDDLRRINDLVVQRGKQMLLEELEQRSSDEDQDGSTPADAGKQLALDELIKPSDWPEHKNWGTLTIDACYTPADISYPRDPKLLDEARATTEKVVD